LNRKQRIADQKMQKDIKKDAKVSKGKAKTGDGQKAADGVKSTLEKMLDSAGSIAMTSDAAGSLEEDDMLSVVKRRRQLAAKAAEEKKMKEAQ